VTYGGLTRPENLGLPSYQYFVFQNVALLINVYSTHVIGQAMNEGLG